MNSAVPVQTITVRRAAGMEHVHPMGKSPCWRMRPILRSRMELFARGENFFCQTQSNRAKQTLIRIEREA